MTGTMPATTLRGVARCPRRPRNGRPPPRRARRILGIAAIRLMNTTHVYRAKRRRDPDLLAAPRAWRNPPKSPPRANQSPPRATQSPPRAQKSPPWALQSPPRAHHPPNPRPKNPPLSRSLGEKPFSCPSRAGNRGSESTARSVQASRVLHFPPWGPTIGL